MKENQDDFEFIDDDLYPVLKAFSVRGKIA